MGRRLEFSLILRDNEGMTEGLVAVIAGAFERHEQLFRATQGDLFPDIEKAAALLADAVQVGATMFACGNGGSAADAQHFVAEFTCRYKEDRKPLSAVLLGANYSHLTAVGNDYSFDDIFSRELEALGRAGDILIAFTTSGSSKNILKAIDVARAKNMKIIVLTGERGKALAGSGNADIVLAVPSMETARIQEMHELIYHAWCEFIDANIIH